MKWFHAIGISGKATANIAKLFKDMGWFVTGSDNQFLPPASTIIEENKIPHAIDYHFSHLTKEFWEKELKKKLKINEVPDLVMIVESLSNKNKEYLFAKNKNIDVRPYSKILSEYLVKKNSIVVVGTAGKTTTTALITKIMKDIGFDPSFMIGAEVLDFPESLENTKSVWSVLEGDEYHNKELADGAKFLEYKTKYLVISNIGYEHQDIFPTQKEYIEEFRKLTESVPQDGLIVARLNDKNIDETLKNSKANIIRYEVIKNKKDFKKGVWAILSDKNINTIFDGKGKEVLSFKTNLIGNFVLEDILAAVTLILNIPAKEITIDIFSRGIKYLEDIRDSVESFKGVKKRLEILYEDKNTVIIDDFGVAPERAKNSLKTLKEHYPKHKIVSVFEPNSGSRFKDEKEFSKNYKNVFSDSVEVIIPVLSEFNKELATTSEFVERLKKLKVNAKHVDSKDIAKIVSERIGNDKIVIVFFSSYRLDSIAKQVVQHMN